MLCELTQEILKSIFDYKDGFLYWKVKVSDKIIIGEKAGCEFNSQGGNYYYIQFYKKRYKSSRLIFFWHNGYFPKNVDHIDRNTLNDKIENLRAATDQENTFNSGSTKNSTSKYKGVSWSNGRNKWVAQITVNYKQIPLGRFNTEEEAAKTYNDAVKMYRDSQFSYLNTF